MSVSSKAQIQTCKHSTVCTPSPDPADGSRQNPRLGLMPAALTTAAAGGPAGASLHATGHRPGLSFTSLLSDVHDVDAAFNELTQGRLAPPAVSNAAGS